MFLNGHTRIHKTVLITGFSQRINSCSFFKDTKLFTFSKNEAEQTKAESIMEDHMESNRIGNYTSHKEN